MDTVDKFLEVQIKQKFVTIRTMEECESSQYEGEFLCRCTLKRLVLFLKKRSEWPVLPSLAAIPTAVFIKIEPFIVHSEHPNIQRIWSRCDDSSSSAIFFKKRDTFPEHFLELSS